MDPLNMAGAMSISVIIPALNEAGTIGAAVRGLPPATGVEVIVVDGGSADATKDIAREAGAKVVVSAPGRAKQQNEGARHASGDALVFLHADTKLPPDFITLVKNTLQTPGVIAGAFSFRLDREFRGSRIVEALANFRSRVMHMPYGDQAIFITARTFREAGGFPVQPIMEDFELVRRLKKLGRVAHVEAPATTSARRWANMGALRVTLVNQAVILAYMAGVSRERIARWYAREKGVGQG